MVTVFKIVSWLEGISFLLLLFVAMPFKYLEALGNDPTYVKMLGMPHGLFFVGYIVLAVMLKYDFNWKLSTLLKVCALAVIPFGTFFVGKYLKK